MQHARPRGIGAPPSCWPRAACRSRELARAASGRDASSTDAPGAAAPADAAATAAAVGAAVPSRSSSGNGHGAPAVSGNNGAGAADGAGAGAGGAAALAAPTLEAAQAQAQAEAEAAAAPGGTRRGGLEPLDKEILAIALPMLATLAAEPCAALVDTAFVGRLGAAQLAGVGVALSVYNTVTKLVQVPLLSIATTTVAAAKGAERQQQQQQQRHQGATGDTKGHSDGGAGAGGAEGTEGDEVSSAASAALLVAAGVGLGVAGLLLTCGPSLAAFWGIGAGSALRGPALDFLTLRAVGAPVSIVLLVAQGCFRGLQDTRTPFFATLLTNVLNITLDYTLIFVVGMGVRGAALATVFAQLLPCVWLLHRLGGRCRLCLADAGTVRSLAGLLGPTGFLVLRTVAIAGTYAVATALTARSGAQAAAAHQVCNQLWLASSLLSDALAVAAQSLVARSLAAGEAPAARRVVGRTVGMAAALGCAMALLMAAGAGRVPGLFSRDPEVLSLVAGSVWAFVVLTQPVNSMAFVWDGVLFGAGGFKYACVQMSLSCAPAVALMLLLAGGDGAPPPAALTGVWAGLSCVMLLRWLLIAVPYRAGAGPFAKMYAPAAGGGWAAAAAAAAATAACGERPGSS